MNKSVYLCLSISEISKIVMHEFWYYYVKRYSLHEDKRHLLRHCKGC